ncbi:PQ-loop domain-containing transporter [Sedimentibacter sp. MB31-C6]|uniref:PQ-loop domain-containing transporter n=1 Tax=Sedimentibacter sp. MB31-C6 TaxID=3109366 RepID=UPI002DDC9111|nr:PQ-loop domain-containing transporter [Sedimentibacter sp. MB36-C1]WSI05015.1 PQ-loop domain-containing transporter [Sedimentibacter sp. MB36-C1]
MSIFEILMLLCFGAAWPFSIYKSYKSKSVAGKSPYFLVILMSGYVFGILNKIIYNFDVVIYLYGLNLIMVSTDFILYLRNIKLAKDEKNNVG